MRSQNLFLPNVLSDLGWAPPASVTDSASVFDRIFKTAWGNAVITLMGGSFPNQHAANPAANNFRKQRSVFLLHQKPITIQIHGVELDAHCMRHARRSVKQRPMPIANSSTTVTTLDQTCRLTLVSDPAFRIHSGTFPGYYVTVFTVDRIGRKRLQYIGFIMMTILLIILSAAYNQLRENAKWVFVIL